MSESTPTEQLIEQATQWLVLLRSGAASEAQVQAYQAWRAQDPRHDHLCAQLERTLGVFQVPIAQGIGSGVLNRAIGTTSRRKVLQGALVGAGVMLGAGFISHRISPFNGLTADLRTATGQRQRIALDDGSELILNARSVVALNFTREQRLLRLYSGELLARVTDDSRPFRVQTPQGLVQIQNSQLLVRQRDTQSQVIAFETPAEIALQGGDRLHLQAGQHISFDGNRFGTPSPALLSETAWVDGFLELHDRPLSDVIDALRPYRAGVLRLDPQIAGLRVSGLFRLDDSDLVLDSLERTLPIRVTRRTNLWVSLVAA